jgi:FtsZ-binding cell division protein ZapB
LDPATITAVTTSLKALSELAALIPKKDDAARQQFTLLEQQIRLVKEQAESLSREVDSLRGQNGQLEREIRELQERLAHHELTTDYKRIDGMDWKQDERGEWEDGPYCPNDHALMSNMLGSLFTCPKCRYQKAPTRRR